MAATKKTTTTKAVKTVKNRAEIKISENLTIGVNVHPTIEERLLFVKAVADGAFIDNRAYQILADAWYDILFIEMFTDYSFPKGVKSVDEKIDIEAAHNQIYEVFRFDFRNRLKENEQIEVLIESLENDVNQNIENENKKIVALHSRNIVLEETFENMNMLIDKGVSLINDLTQKLNTFTPESIGDIVKNIPEGFLSLLGDVSSTKSD